MQKEQASERLVESTLFRAAERERVIRYDLIARYTDMAISEHDKLRNFLPLEKMRGSDLESMPLLGTSAARVILQYLMY